MTPPEFRALVAQGPAVVMVAKDDMLKLLDERERYRSALMEAVDMVLFWSAYASDYFQDKHDLEADVGKLTAALEPSP